jgi:hypothetical protein
MLLKIGIMYDLMVENRKQTSVALSTTKEEYITTSVEIVKQCGFRSYLQGYLI